MLRKLRAWFQTHSVPLSVPQGFQFYCMPAPDRRPFEHGVEVLNDDVTPILFVTNVLHEEAGLSHGDASVASVICHREGGVIVQTATRQQAADTADRVVARASREGWPLRCRAVSGSSGIPAPGRTDGEASQETPST